MSSVPVLKSKLTMPELTESFLLTERLQRLYKDMDNCRAVTVCAPAGYGKTTLAVSYLNCHAARPCRICWYRLDSEDASLPIFLAHLKEVIFPAEAAAFEGCRKALEEHVDMHTPRQIISMICRELWEIHNKDGDTRIYLVLDDFQNVAQNQDICDLTRYLLNSLPPYCTMILMNRASLSVFTEKQKLEKRILEIALDDLTFSNAEIEAFMCSIGQTAADRKLIDFIEKNTEGWIAGIIILYQALKSKKSDTVSIQPEKLIHDDALFRYLSLEVLKSVKGEMQSTLARLALLEEFSEDEAAEILEIDDIKSLMDQCMVFGMFVQRIPGIPVVYRFHSLFREFLLSILNDRYTPEQIVGFHLKAARYFMRNGIYGRSAEHLVKCGNSKSAMEMVSNEGFKKLMIGETGQLKQWLDLLPEDMIRNNPVLLLYQAQLMPNSRQPEMLDTLEEVLHLSIMRGDLATYYDAATVLIYIFMCGNNMKGLVRMTDGLSEKRMNVSAELANTLLIIDMVRSIGEGRFTDAEAQSESIRIAALPEDSQWLYLILSCIIYCCLGKLDLATRCMDTALELIRFNNIEPSTGFILMFLSMSLMMKNERASLPSHIGKVLAIGKKYDYEYLSAHGYRLSAFDKYLSFERDAAVSMLQQSAFHFLRINNKAMAAACRLQGSLWRIHQNEFAPDLEEAKKELALIRELCPGLLIDEAAQSVVGAIARESGDYSFAESSLISSMKASKEKKGQLTLCGTGFHLARLYFTKGDTEQGKHILKQTLELAACSRFFMFWDIHIPTLADMALRGVRYGYCTSYAEELLHRYFGQKSVNYLCEKVKIMEESGITSFVDAFVCAYNTDQTEQYYLVQASLFGTSEIKANGVRIPDTEWKTKKVKAFFEYLLFQSGNTVSKEVLAELLWPDADSKSSTASQRTALYYLRKTLSRYHVEVTGANAFILETPEGLKIRKDTVLELDLLNFQRLYNEWTLLEKQMPQDEQKLADILKAMILLYKGDLMEGSDFGDMIFQERERLRSVFLEACQRLSSISVRTGDFRQAEDILRRAFAAEPFDENICLELLKLYMVQGRKSKAVKLYYSFKKRLEEELGIRIDKRLTAAIRSSEFEK